RTGIRLPLAPWEGRAPPGLRCPLRLVNDARRFFFTCTQSSKAARNRLFLSRARGARAAVSHPVRANVSVTTGLRPGRWRVPGRGGGSGRDPARLGLAPAALERLHEAAQVALLDPTDALFDRRGRPVDPAGLLGGAADVGPLVRVGALATA